MANWFLPYGHDVLKQILSMVGGITKIMNPQNVCWNEVEEADKASDIELFRY